MSLRFIYFSAVEGTTQPMNTTRFAESQRYTHEGKSVKKLSGGISEGEQIIRRGKEEVSRPKNGESSEFHPVVQPRGTTTFHKHHVVQ